MNPASPCLRKGVLTLPEGWREADTWPVKKKGGEESFANHRPVNWTLGMGNIQHRSLTKNICDSSEEEASMTKIRSLLG